MAEQQSTARGLQASEIVSTGKDAMSLMRDVTLFVLAVLLIVFPKRFNTMLSDAGFDKGTFMGMEWKSGLARANSALEDAQEGISTLAARNAELLKELTTLKAAATNPAIKEQVARIEADTTDMNQATRKVQVTVSQAIASNVPLIAQLNQTEGLSKEVSDYLVGLQTLGLTDDQRKQLNERIRALGYRLHELSVSYQERPKWFAKRSTVFYYAPSSRAAAEALARALKEITSREFAVQRGSGSGVDPSQQGVTLFVHDIKG